MLMIQHGQGKVGMQPLLQQRVRMNVDSDMYICTEDEDAVYHLYVKGKMLNINTNISPQHNSRCNST